MPEGRSIFARLRPPAGAGGQPSRDLALEALRGLCALLVFYAHAFAPTRALDPRYEPSTKFYWFDLGLAAVLMFFTMSGYVIGLTIKEPVSATGMKNYLRRRAVRLLPVTCIAIALAWCFAPSLDGPRLWGHLFFLQNDAAYPVTGWHFPLLQNNPALWTLHYEALYYLLFLGVWWLAPSPALLFGLLTVLTFGPALGLSVPEMTVRHACGAYYWMGGLCLAWLPGGPPVEPEHRSHWPSALLCAYALWNLGGLRVVFLDAHLDSLMWLTVLSPHRLDFLPACLWCILAVTGKAPGGQRVLATGCLLWGWFGFGHACLAGDLRATDILSGLALLAATGCLGWKPGLTGLQHFAPLGAISFGLYAFASPIQLGQRAWLPEFSGSALTFVIRLAAVFSFTVGLAWLLDFRLYRWLSARLRRLP